MDTAHFIEHLRQDACAFEAAWVEENQRHGRGALVFFLLDKKETAVNELECRYWTLEEIRSLLRDLTVEDEFAFRWIIDCEETGGLPVIILSPGGATGSFDLCFHRLRAVAD